MGIPRTPSTTEAWHGGWENIAWQEHTGVYNIIKEFQKEWQGRDPTSMHNAR